MLSITNIVRQHESGMDIVIPDDESYVILHVIIGMDYKILNFKFLTAEREEISTVNVPQYKYMRSRRKIGDVIMIILMEESFVDGEIVETDKILWTDVKTGKHGMRDCNIDTIPIIVEDTIHYIETKTNDIVSWNIKTDDVTFTGISPVVFEYTIYAFKYKLEFVHSSLCIFKYAPGIEEPISKLYNANGEVIIDNIPSTKKYMDRDNMTEDIGFCQDGSYYFIPYGENHLEYVIGDGDSVNLGIRELLDEEGVPRENEMFIYNVFKDDNTTVVWIRVFSEDNEDDDVFFKLSSRMKRAKNARK